MSTFCIKFLRNLKTVSIIIVFAVVIATIIGGLGVLSEKHPFIGIPIAIIFTILSLVALITIAEG